MTCGCPATDTFGFASTPRRRNIPYTGVTDSRSVNADELQALNDHYVAQTNWLVRRGRDDLIDMIADEYERDLSAIRARSQDSEEPDRAA